ncbi:alpha/beta hydrolase [uncultured Ralstonia sp.]|mgnify:CR=1 FL=1|jgi:predicted alpha/beta hydrolase family esterase|uniref:RBBP9/YdeN family alpha/beta hydrolase n=1 Tax=uncultured Ralstonia sp. TaxID=114715 RepID=UPI001EA980F1|nr:alpha/beta hydrolase [uncultured Ralstonia sp.]UCF24763.1 MAG: serine hydrolase family protein [Ralstonia sp.]
MARSAAQPAADRDWHWPADLAVLTVPGLHGSGPGHWQSHWEHRFADWQRVEQDDWGTPDLRQWSARVGETVRAVQAARPRQGVRAVLVAHSFGCLASLHWAMQARSAVAGVLLVAPADPDKFGVADLLPQRALPFPAIVVASRNDPWLSYCQAVEWGIRWGAEIVDAGHAGHINADSGLGDWAPGLALLDRLIGRASAPEASRDGADWQAQWDVLPSTPYI